MPSPVAPISAASPAGAVNTTDTPDLVVQAGSVVDARVVQVNSAGLARIMIAQTLLDVMTSTRVTPGDQLRLAVSQDADGTVRLTVVGQGASAATAQAARDAATPAALNATRPLPSAEAAALMRAVADGVAGQKSLAPLFANLATVAARPDAPPALRAMVDTVMAMRPALTENLTAPDLKAAAMGSGLFLESRLAQGVPAGVPDLKAALVVLRQMLTTLLPPQGQSAATPAAAQTSGNGAANPAVNPPAGGMPSVPAPPTSAPPQGVLPAGIPQSVPMTGQAGQTGTSPSLAASATASTSAPASAVSPTRPPAEAATAATTAMRSTLATAATAADIHPRTAAILLSRLQEGEMGLREVARTSNESKAAGLDPARLLGMQSANNGVDPPGQPATPPPLRGTAPSPQPVALASLAQDTPLDRVAHELIRDVDGAIARQTLLQIASLPDGMDGAPRMEPAGARWHFEIPFATPQGTAMAQFEIARDGHGAGGPTPDARPNWQARFTIAIEPIGPVHAQIVLAGERASVRLWAERPQSAAMLRENTAGLSASLREAALEPGDIIVGEGTPSAVQAAAAGRAGRYLDRAT